MLVLVTTLLIPTATVAVARILSFASIKYSEGKVLINVGASKKSYLSFPHPLRCKL